MKEYAEVALKHFVVLCQEARSGIILCCWRQAAMHVNCRGVGRRQLSQNVAVKMLGRTHQSSPIIKLVMDIFSVHCLWKSQQFR